MKNPYNAKALIQACADNSFDAGITIRSTLVPLAGDGAPVKPAVYEGGRYQLDHRWVEDAEVGRRSVPAIVIDNVPSQANRLEAALARLQGRLGLPEVRLDLTDVARPAQIQPLLSSFLFPHRQADAYLRDANTADGTPFIDSPQGKQLLVATADSPEALLQWFPQALLFGFWQSHYGKKSATQAKLARSWVSEIVGYEPAYPKDEPNRVLGLKGDPLNLTSERAIVYDENDTTTWSLGDKLKDSSKTDEKKKPSAIGHGQVPFTRDGDTALAAVSFSSIVQQSTCSFASLRRINAATSEASAAARALLVALGVVAHVAAFGRSFSLRSGAELKFESSTWTWLGESADDTFDAPNLETSISVFNDCVEAARDAKLPVGSGDWAVLDLVPNANLSKVIEQTFTADS